MTLVLNRNYIPIRLSSRYSAIGKIYCGVAEPLYFSEGSFEIMTWDSWFKMSALDVWPEDQEFIMSTTQRVAIPRVIKCVKYDKIPRVNMRLSRRAIYSRDDHTCYICGEQFSENKLSIDHVIPTSRGGTNTWENMATCCNSCNAKKDDHLLRELGIKPKFMPSKPTMSNISKLKSGMTRHYDEWSQFGV
jgi:5-methylcytosine-specific restriction endonuclease McrA